MCPAVSPHAGAPLFPHMRASLVVCVVEDVLVDVVDDGVLQEVLDALPALETAPHFR